MKDVLRKAFAPILDVFESGDDPVVYKASHRTILIVMSFLFSVLASSVCLLSWGAEDKGFLIPVVVFGLVGFVGFVVGTLGTDRAVAKIWGNKS
ncbi:hypothetical protein NBRC116188_26140 [Oceaniserpentilla sp. 4NH20-0058]|uniref:hypothetical protein n=1 Tax=Oceaniserpentilla sp. 4NH20-0058 TaxID=3127660 RepID=UPI003103BA40